MAIKMRINNDKDSRCNNCNTEWENTAEMYDVHICKTTFTLCRKCTELLFHKTLRASVLYNAKIKTKQDQKRISNEYNLNHSYVGSMSIVEALKGIKMEEKE